MLTIENTDSDLKVQALHYANELLVRVSFPFKNFCKLAQHSETIRKKCLGRDEWRVLVVDKSTDNDKPHFNLFFTTISTPVKETFFFRARAEKGIGRHIDVSSGMNCCRQRPSNFWLVRSEHAHASYPGLSFRPPGFSPYMVRRRKESSETGLPSERKEE